MPSLISWLVLLYVDIGKVCGTQSQQISLGNKLTYAMENLKVVSFRVGVNSGIEWELSAIPDSIPGIGLGIGIEKKGIGIELELKKNARN